MNILGDKKKSEVIYEHSSLAILVAIPYVNNTLVRAFFKQYKNKKNPPSDKVIGYKMIIDEEFDSLKIDFSNPCDFIISELKLFPLK